MKPFTRLTLRPGYTSKNVLQELGDRELEAGRKVGLIWMRC